MSAPLCIHCGSLALTRERAAPSRAFCGRECQVASYALIEGKRTREEWDRMESITLVSSDGKRIEVAAALLQYSKTLRNLLKDVVTREIDLPSISWETLRRIVRVLETYHNLPVKAPLPAAEYDQIIGQIDGVDDVLALVTAINYLDIVATGALTVAFYKLWRTMTPATAFRVFEAIPADLFGAFLAHYTTLAYSPITAEILCAGFAGILTEQVPRQRHIDAIVHFFAPGSPLQMGQLETIIMDTISRIPDNARAYEILVTAYLVRRGTVNELLAYIDNRQFSTWLLKARTNRLSPQSIAEFVGESLGRKSAKLPEEEQKKLVRVVKLAISRYEFLVVVDTLSAHNVHLAMEVIYGKLVDRMRSSLPLVDTIENIIRWMFATFTTKFDYIQLVATASHDAISMTLHRASGIRLLKLLAPYMQQQLAIM